MSLTDPHLFTILVILSVLAFVGVVIFWPKMAKGGFRSVLLRISTLVLVNLLVITSIGVALNNYGQFYSSWNELLGQKEKAPLIVDSPNIKVSSADLSKGKFTKSGSVTIRRIVRGDISGITAEVYFSLPPSFVKAIRSGLKPRNDYPIFTFLSGYPGYETAWIKGMKVVEREDDLVRRGKIPEVISVFPQVNVAGQFDAECMNINGGPQVESWLTNDVVSFTNQWLGLTNRAWNIVGYSTGGWCATMLSLRHPVQFSTAASIAGYYRPAPAKQVTPEGRARLMSEYDIYRTMRDSKPPVALYVVNSTGDRPSHASTNEFLKEARKYINVTEVVLNGAGHNFNAWKQVVDPILIWFGSKSVKIAQ